MSINIAFWNVGVSPLFYSKPNFIRAKDIYDLIGNIINAKCIDVFILCEMNESAIALLEKTLSGFQVFKANDKVSPNLYFDMVFIVSHKLTVVEKNPIFGRSKDKDGYPVKAGYHLLVKVKSGLVDSNEKKINIIASHWPSKIRDSESFQKNHAAKMLSRFIDIERAKSDRQVVLIGDYNDEYHSSAIKDTLYSTINRHYASLDSEILYNLSGLMSGPHIPNMNGVDYHHFGTWISSDEAFRKKDVNSNRIFDQIMLCSSMINKGPWIVNERRSGIVNNERLRNMVSDGEIDHLPICLSIDARR